MEVGPLWYGGAISWNGLVCVGGPLVSLHGKVKAAPYVNILGDQVHPFVQTSFPGECPLYQDDNAPIHTAKIVQECFAEHEVEVGHLDWPPQSPDLNIIEHLWGYLESKLRARFPPPSTISALETALNKEWLHIPLQVIHDLYASLPRRIHDEAHFWLNGYVNKQNCRIWSEANPQVYVETPLHPEKLTVWCALWAGGILLQKR
ncbi:transposable element Tcb2 transposase [Trichonephila clavipes]|nr:transposable element Tcb2 transposase [Trichonephila clavipes]